MRRWVCVAGGSEGKGLAALTPPPPIPSHTITQSVAWISSSLRFDRQEGINLFEATIRLVGGLLSSWELSARAHPVLLARAASLADALLPAFDSPSGLPYGTLDLRSRAAHNPAWAQGASTISEVASVQLEFEYLSHVTGDPRYALAARRVMTHLQVLEPEDSLYPMFISPETGLFLGGGVITLGARGDSLYEYLLKQFLLAGGGAGGITGNAALLSRGVPTAAYAPPGSSRVVRAVWRQAGFIACLERMAMQAVQVLVRKPVAAGDAAAAAANATADAVALLQLLAKEALPSVPLGSWPQLRPWRLWYACTDALDAPCWEAAAAAAAAALAEGAETDAGPTADASADTGGGGKAEEEEEEREEELEEGDERISSAYPWYLGVQAKSCGFQAGRRYLFEHRANAAAAAAAMSAAATAAAATAAAATATPAPETLQSDGDGGAENSGDRAAAAAAAAAAPTSSSETAHSGEHGDGGILGESSVSEPTRASAEAAVDDATADASAGGGDYEDSGNGGGGGDGDVDDGDGDVDDGDGVDIEAAADSAEAVLALPHIPSSPTSEASYFSSLFGMYLRSMAGVEGSLVREASPSRLLYIAERLGNASLEHKMDHLVCFAPGMLALGSRAAPTPALAARHLALARRLLETCIHMYGMTATGLAPEITRFAGGGDPAVDGGSRHNLLRPETVESLFVLYRVTGEQRWRDAGWEIFSAFQRHCRVPAGGFSSIGDVTALPAAQTDAQESFWLAETLKYFYLLFSDSALLPLDQVVFNTEAHPLPIFGTVAAPVSDWPAMRAAHTPPSGEDAGGEGGEGRSGGAPDSVPGEAARGEEDAAAAAANGSGDEDAAAAGARGDDNVAATTS